MAASVSAWSKPGTWAVDSEEHEAELLHQAPVDPPAADFPSLSAAAKTTRKKKNQTLSLAEFSAKEATYSSPSARGGFDETALSLPSGPRERTAETVSPVAASSPVSVEKMEAPVIVPKQKGSNPFGEARPWEEVLAEKGQDWKEIDEGLNMEEEIRQILLRTSLLDVCGESNASEIRLVNIDISQLPQSPSCLMLTGLFLQMNSDLTLIPSSFFRYMPCLQILNLSCTSISSLPESLFQLFGLEKLYLKDCELFTELPSKIKELKNLKELDLEGTALLNLPKEVGYLEKLTCLKVSFHGDLGLNSETMIPTGILSKLSMLMSLCIAVDPADRRWDEAVKVVIRELSYLKQLQSLEMYMPEVTLLDELRMSLPSFIHDSATKFRLTVGRHQRRIIPWIPLGVEGQFGSSNKCLKYVNGNELNSNISTQVIDVLKHCDSFFLNRHFTITELAKLGVENMEKLRFCVLGENDELLTIISGGKPYATNIATPYAPLPLLEKLIIYRMKNMRSIVEGPLETRSLCSLESLILNGCPGLEAAFTLELCSALKCLRELVVEDCPAISSLVRCESTVEETELVYYLASLENLSLHHLPELESIFGIPDIAPNLERMSVYGCPKLHSLPKVSWTLKVIRGEKHWFNALQWEDQSSKRDASEVFVPIGNGSHFKTQLAADGFNV